MVLFFDEIDALRGQSLISVLSQLRDGYNSRSAPLVFDRHRQCWELPGGSIDPGETARQAAVRELHEESGCRVEQLIFAGFAQFLLGPEQRVEYAAVYAGHAASSDRFTPNDEIAAITWWDGTEPLAGRMQPLDVCLGRLARAVIVRG
ncbi:hypothetical protein BCD49_38115 [Pseudofrankia sp. EUN1h]|nr:MULTISPECIES: NUDIX domain-containing protein [Pseudofrankia]OHV28152.1 hypothetical protein BCD49_38115 [Pseudofrankia sp. EUN1h]